MQVIGDIADKTKVIVNFTNVAGTNVGGFAAFHGGMIGMVDGMTLNGVGAIVGSTLTNMTGSETATTTSWVKDSYAAGIGASGAGSLILLGAHLSINHFYYSVAADENAQVSAFGGGVTGTDAGDVNFLARHGAMIHCTPCTGNRAVDTTPAQLSSGGLLGCNFTAEDGGRLEISGSSGSNSAIGAVCGISNGSAWGHNFIASGGLGGLSATNSFGIWAVEGAYLEMTGARVSRYNVGVYASGGAGIALGGGLVTANRSDGMQADGGHIETGGTPVTNNRGYGFHALHQGKIQCFSASPASCTGSATGNLSGIASVEAAGTLNGFPYSASTFLSN